MKRTRRKPTEPDGRANNRRQPKDLSALKGKRYGLRTITGVITHVTPSGSRQLLVAACQCGSVSHVLPSHFTRKPPRCKSCHDTGKRTRQPYDECVNKRFVDWTVKRVMRSKERGKYVYFECECTCGRVAQVYAKDVLSGKTHRCRMCARDRQHRRGAGGAPAPVVAPRQHKQETVIIDGVAVTRCRKCWMESTWPGWGNPCGSPVVASKRFVSDESLRGAA